MVCSVLLYGPEAKTLLKQQTSKCWRVLKCGCVWRKMKRIDKLDGVGGATVSNNMEGETDGYHGMDWAYSTA